jgi:hypothetical protein
VREVKNFNARPPDARAEPSALKYFLEISCTGGGKQVSTWHILYSFILRVLSCWVITDPFRFWNLMASERSDSRIGRPTPTSQECGHDLFRKPACVRQ